MAAADVVSLPGSSLGSSLDERCLDESETTESSGSLAFIPIFPYPGLFPYHAIGGSLDYHMDTSSYGTYVSGYSFAKGADAFEVGASTDLEIDIDNPIIRQITMETEAPTHDNDKESLGNYSELTTDSTHSSSPMASFAAHREESETVESLDILVWQRCQSRFTRSRTPLLDGDDKEVDAAALRSPALLGSRTPLIDDDDKELDATPLRSPALLGLESDYVDPVEEQHMQIRNVLPAISEDLHEDAPLELRPTALNSSSIPLVPLRRDHSSGGSHLADDIATIMERLARQSMTQEED